VKTEETARKRYQLPFSSVACEARGRGVSSGVFGPQQLALQTTRLNGRGVAGVAVADSVYVFASE
jgi:hypothetical protein